PPPAPSATTPTTTATSAPSKRLPKSHTVDHEGVMHAPGDKTPMQKCAGCHGKDLKGGKIAPSCFDCHEQKW
ncbi:MAG: hypothetical protein ACYC9N_18085, partial [Thermoanaerobaculia bacterium]